MNFGFSYLGALWLIMLFVPNILWTRCKPQGYDQAAISEPSALTVCERIGEVSVTCCALIFDDLNFHMRGAWLVWLALSFVLMVLYEVWWVRYFQSEHTLRDFYSSLFGIPLAGATLPVMAFAALAIYGRCIPLAVCDAILAIGHIGIHAYYRQMLLK